MLVDVEGRPHQHAKAAFAALKAADAAALVAVLNKSTLSLATAVFDAGSAGIVETSAISNPPEQVTLLGAVACYGELEWDFADKDPHDDVMKVLLVAGCGLHLGTLEGSDCDLLDFGWHGWDEERVLKLVAWHAQPSLVQVGFMSIKHVAHALALQESDDVPAHIVWAALMCVRGHVRNVPGNGAVYLLARDRFRALTMALHWRLGAQSPMCVLTVELLQRIARFLY